MLYLFLFHTFYRPWVWKRRQKGFLFLSLSIWKMTQNLKVTGFLAQNKVYKEKWKQISQAESPVLCNGTFWLGNVTGQERTKFWYDQTLKGIWCWISCEINILVEWDLFYITVLWIFWSNLCTSLYPMIIMLKFNNPMVTFIYNVKCNWKVLVYYKSAQVINSNNKSLVLYSLFVSHPGQILEVDCVSSIWSHY